MKILIIKFLAYSKSLLLSFVLLIVASVGVGSAIAEVRLGIDCLRESEFKSLVGLRVGLITNHTGVDSNGRATADLFAEAEQFELVRLFGPEHGIRGELDQAMIDDGVDGPTGLPIVSLYGPRRKPEPSQIADLDVLVFDIQDIGCRFYTYISTMKLAMEAASEAGIRFVVLDRPNPLSGLKVAGPMLDSGSESFVACHELPIQHGMTIGELAKLLAKEGTDGEPMAIDLSVIACEGWKRGMDGSTTGQMWINPSPNMRRLSQAITYPGIGLLETTNLSVGRGTDTPFEWFGAPWIDSKDLAKRLNERLFEIKQEDVVRFVPHQMTPSSSKFAGELCGGVDVLLLESSAYQSVEVGLLTASTIHELYPKEWESKRYRRLLCHEAIYQAIKLDKEFAEIQRLHEEGMQAFLERRAEVLIYSE